MSLLVGISKFEQNFGIIWGHIMSYEKLELVMKPLEASNAEKYRCDLFSQEGIR